MFDLDPLAQVVPGSDNMTVFWGPRGLVNMSQLPQRYGQAAGTSYATDVMDGGGLALGGLGDAHAGACDYCKGIQLERGENWHWACSGGKTSQLCYALYFINNVDMPLFDLCWYRQRVRKLVGDLWTGGNWVGENKGQSEAHKVIAMAGLPPGTSGRGSNPSDDDPEVLACSGGVGKGEGAAAGTVPAPTSGGGSGPAPGGGALTTQSSPLVGTSSVNLEKFATYGAAAIGVLLFGAVAMRILKK